MKLGLLALVIGVSAGSLFAQEGSNSTDFRRSPVAATTPCDAGSLPSLKLNSVTSSKDRSDSSLLKITSPATGLGKPKLGLDTTTPEPVRRELVSDYFQKICPYCSQPAEGGGDPQVRAAVAELKEYIAALEAALEQCRTDLKACQSPLKLR
jgi:hypothetical protein